MEPVKLGSPVKVFVVSVALDSQEQTVMKVKLMIDWLISELITLSCQNKGVKVSEILVFH